MTLKAGAIFYVSSRLLGRFPALAHTFLGRGGGVSREPFSSLNCASAVGDRAKDVEKNREIIGKTFGFDPQGLVTVRQVHGENVFLVEKRTKKEYETVEADSIVTHLGGMAIGVLTADCLPVLLFDPGKKAIAAVHAGRKGTVKCVVEKTVAVMRRKFGSDPEDILASLGPHIGWCCYGVGEEVASEFKETFGDCGLHIGAEEVRLDLKAVNLMQLKRAGLREKNIDAVGSCTSCRNDLFFSYRKDGGTTGRQLSFIMLRER